MRKLLSKIFIFWGVLSLVLGTFNIVGQSISYAENLELIGTNLGLEIIPTSTKLFDLQNLNPGDNKQGKITIKNNYVSPFNLYMKTERMSPSPAEGEVDLFDKIILTVSLRGSVVYSGPMKDFATSSIFLGVFNPNDIEDLEATISLPGSETGNEFQGKGVDVKWIFIATSEVPPVTPEPPITPPITPTPPPAPSTTVTVIPMVTPLAVPELPEEIEIIEEEIPLSVPEIPEEIEDIEEEIEEEKIALGIPKLPKTGELSPMMFYGVGMIFILMGLQLGFKKRNN